MSSDDREFDIELGASSVRRHHDGVSPIKDRSRCACPCGSPEPGSLQVFIASDVISAVRRQAADNPDTEVGGVLLGRFHKNRKEAFLEVTGIIEAVDAKSTGVSLTFTHETWEHIARAQATEPDAAIVGWYHSHPGLGVFLSKEDQFIHSSYFSEPWQVALVVDPERGNLGLFAAADGEPRQIPGFYVFGSREEADAVRECAKTISQANRTMPILSAAGVWKPGPVVWALIAALVLAQIATGYLLLAGRRTAARPDDRYAQAMMLLSACDLSGAEQMLRLALIENPSDENAARELQRIAAVASAPGVENPSMDRVNFLLKIADEAASGGVKPVGRGELENLIPDADKPKLRVEARDPTADAFRIYKEVAGSRGARLARAAAIERAAASHGSPAWSKKALNWLKQERLREIAYGIHSGQSGYERIYDRLPDSEKAAVRSYRASIGRGK